MANASLFKRLAGTLLPKTDTRNFENAPAYAFSPKHALAQYAVTGCMNHTFYADAELQLSDILALCAKIEPEFIARTAIFARRESYMKDVPALLCAALAVRDLQLHEQVFEQVVDNLKMLRTYVQILRSGVVGRRSLGSAPKRLVLRWLETRNEDDLFRASPGASPSLADIVKMTHPKPANATRQAFYGYMIGRAYDAEALPSLVREFERFKSGEQHEVPELPFTMLSALPLSQQDWASIAENTPWQTLRMNINTFARHGVFGVAGMAERIASRLRDPEAIRRARVFPYQLLAAFVNCEELVPAMVREALQDAMEIATASVPAVQGQVFVCPDVSGSMMSPVTGRRKGATTKVRCIDVAALVAAALVRKNPTAEVLPFEQRVVRVELNPRDSIMTNAAKLASIGGGGTNCSAPLQELNARGARGDLVVLVSDNQSWVDAGQGLGTKLMSQWQRFRQRNPQARLVCLDIQPYATTQAVEREDILNIGGFSDRVVEVIALFAEGKLGPEHSVGLIEDVVI
jgi:60 kDa SS-A/Ro ribonucleoprotein